MTDMDDEAMKAMARRIADSMNTPTSGSWTLAYDASLATIIETQERCAALAESKFADKGWNPQYRNASLSIAAAIRSGQQFRKDV